MRQVANTIQFNQAIVLRHVDERDSLFTSGAWLKKIGILDWFWEKQPDILLAFSWSLF